MSDDSPAVLWVRQLVRDYGAKGAHERLDAIAGLLSVVELADLGRAWADFWARPKQRPPAGQWRSWGAFGARAWGKTRTFSEYVHEQVYLGEAPRIALAAQTEPKSIEIQIEGESGLLATAHPDFMPEWEVSKLQLTWPNGSIATVLTPEVPGGARGPNFHLAWLTEMQSWPAATMHEFHSNVTLATRLGNARTLWDATPKKRHSLLLERLKMSKREPERHVIVTGEIYENAGNLGDGVVGDFETLYGGTGKGDEELKGIMREDNDDALVQMAWINDNRRRKPDRLIRSALGVDPATTKRTGSDCTGIIHAGLGVDDQGYLLGDFTGRHTPDEWAMLVINRWRDERVGVVVVERNIGGDLVVQNIRVVAGVRSLDVVVLGEKEQVPPWRANVMFVREVHSRGEKADRAEPLAIAYKRNRISHVYGVDLKTYEETLTSWVPGSSPKSPDDLDAAVLAFGEIMDLTAVRVDNSKGFEGLAAAAAKLRENLQVPSGGRLLGSLLAGGGGHGRGGI